MIDSKLVWLNGSVRALDWLIEERLVELESETSDDPVVGFSHCEVIVVDSSDAVRHGVVVAADVGSPAVG